MPKIDQTRDVTDIRDMIPHLVLADQYKEVFVNKFIKKLIDDPQGLLVLQGRDEDQNLLCFGIINDPGIDYDFVEVSQIWCAKGDSKKLTNDMYRRIMLWAIGRGKQKLQFETKRNPRAMSRRFGFKVKGVIMECEIKTQDIDKCLNLLGGLI